MGKHALDKLDLEKQFDSKDEYERALMPWQLRVLTIQQEMITTGRRVIGVFEGWDAAGKGGTIKRLTEKLDPRHFRVHGIGAPAADERTHNYLWRFWVRMPESGQITLFDRSWYGRVLVERVEGFAKKREWKRAFHEINEFEKVLVDDGVPVVKFFLHISKTEQLARFRERESSAFKSWKIGPDDWRNRKKWSAYLDATDEMFEKTDTAHAPWHLVEAEYKWWARVKVVKRFAEVCEETFGKPGGKKSGRGDRI
ncbi:MAG: UDP-galactose-lipid carrier transferase [Planctomycetes bacterium]|nr:UDP-galactose-lipid carrier transferase [Planctomycetota bacterium]MBI3843859.1 UDP-galactose-lipid carrier transferase [Planctomycetota bacterium]